MAVLVVFCLAFLGLTWFQGPKLSSAQLDTQAVVASSGQQLRMFANQSLAQVDASQVSVEPAAAFSVDTVGDIVSITFEQRLGYGLDYAVTVSGVTSLHNTSDAVFRYEFTTDARPVFHLDRADPETGEPDRVMRSTLDAKGLSGQESVYSAQGIMDFTVIGQALAVITREGEQGAEQHHLSLVSLADGMVEEIVLPEPGTLDELRSGGSAALGFRFTPESTRATGEGVHTLMWIDLEGSHVPQTVAGIDGSALQPIDWRFLPSGELLALSGDNVLQRVDPTGESPTLPLGDYQGIESVSADGSTAIVRDLYDTILLVLDDSAGGVPGDELPFGPTPIDGVSPFGGQVALLLEGPARVQKVSVFDEGSGFFEGKIVVDDGAVSRILFESVPGTTSIEDFTVSPNGQFVVVEVIPDVSAMVSDAYYPLARPTSITTRFIDLVSGAVVAEVAGFDVEW
ncbi:hypothetical protein FB562_0852 [Homoserinimonas aerilata]|uniref:Uncharacterized protein n=1 Tax=Homoserinimonas aerilata TaxID=1162970 RepID=A0A542YI85_9MICO|nr:hypothetical protein FB562_0852 [Homoserinimonas aerilata]